MSDITIVMAFLSGLLGWISLMAEIRILKEILLELTEKVDRITLKTIKEEMKMDKKNKKNHDIEYIIEPLDTGDFRMGYRFDGRWKTLVEGPIKKIMPVIQNLQQKP